MARSHFAITNPNIDNAYAYSLAAVIHYKGETRIESDHLSDVLFGQGVEY